MGRRPGKPVWVTLAGTFGDAKPMAQEDSKDPLKMSVFGRPVTEGVEEARGLASVSKNQFEEWSLQERVGQTWVHR